MRALACIVALGLSGCAFVLDFDDFRGGSATDAGLDAALPDAAQDGGPEDAGNVDACPPGGCSERVVQVTLGHAHTCARKASGAVYCWGLNASGQLGTGDTTGSATPRRIDALEGAADISAGAFHTCAVRGGDTLCWGENASGQLADGETTPRGNPAPAQNGADAIDVDLGDVHTCIAVTTRTARCAGSYMNGRLGIGERTIDLPRLQQVLTLTDVGSISAGGSHTCAVNGGEPWCWGDNAEGQLGNGTVMEASSPVRVALLTNVTKVSAGGSHTCAISAGGLHCWGRGAEGQIGAITADPTRPMAVTLMPPVMDATAGTLHTCAVDGGRDVLCWGSNVEGQVGQPAGDPISTPTRVDGIAADVERVVAGRAHTCAIDVNGTLWCWGANMNGQLGTGGMAPTSTPTPVAFP